MEDLYASRLTRHVDHSFSSHESYAWTSVEGGLSVYVTTRDAHVFLVTAVVPTPSSEAALLQPHLLASAVQVVHPNWRRIISLELCAPAALLGSVAPLRCASSQSQLSACHFSVRCPESVVANCAPLTVAVQLQTSFVARDHVARALVAGARTAMLSHCTRAVALADKFCVYASFVRAL